ncbi:hypothetical protein [Miniphocaeibacter massiliensis]|uniref:hypothetical protein n=1 Tax=Miniphocaeibacter massiliensis TaxID=2041841 RepID=UPI000C1BA598|nr:hypothetical protein [Miniphocaeibacter massiliensis]
MKFVTLELRKNSCKPYIFADIGIFIAVLVFTFLFASIQYIEPAEVLRDDSLKSSGFILTMSITIATVSYICLAAVMSGKFILEAYNSNNIFLTLSYPVSRKKILFSKIFLVSLFTIISFVMTMILTILIFTVTNNMFSIMEDKITLSLLISKTPMILLSLVFIVSGSMFYLLIGWIKKSLPLVIITAVIFGSIFSNLLGFDSLAILSVFTIVIFSLGLVSIVILNNKIAKLEVE